jgi:excisionase family DNA binding protein
MDDHEHSGREFLTIAECAEYLKYSDRSGAFKWLRREDVKMVRRGRCWLIRKADIDRALERHATGDTVARARHMATASKR